MGIRSLPSISAYNNVLCFRPIVADVIAIAIIVVVVNVVVAGELVDSSGSYDNNCTVLQCHWRA